MRIAKCVWPTSKSEGVGNRLEEQCIFCVIKNDHFWSKVIGGHIYHQWLQWDSFWVLTDLWRRTGCKTLDNQSLKRMWDQ